MLNPSFRLETGPWTQLAQPARAVRTAVFLVEQRIDPALEWDDEDADAWHAVAYQGVRPVGTARLLVHAAHTARIGRMAVLAEARGHGIGQALLDGLLRAARQRGDHTAVLHAQLSARGFYERAGFAAHGPVFVEAGIDHIEMARRLDF